MADKIDEAALQRTYACGMPHNDNEQQFNGADPDSLLGAMTSMKQAIDDFNRIFRPVNTNPSTRKALGEDI